MDITRPAKYIFRDYDHWRGALSPATKLIDGTPRWNNEDGWFTEVVRTTRHSWTLISCLKRELNTLDIGLIRTGDRRHFPFNAIPKSGTGEYLHGETPRRDILTNVGGGYLLYRLTKNK